MSEITEGSGWDDDKITRLKTFWAEGLATAPAKLRGSGRLSRGQVQAKPLTRPEGAGRPSAVFLKEEGLIS